MVPMSVMMPVNMNAGPSSKTLDDRSKREVTAQDRATMLAGATIGHQPVTAFGRRLSR
jgi:hypothetical protein